MFPDGVTFNLTISNPVFKQSLTVDIGDYNYSATSLVEIPILPSYIADGYTLDDFNDCQFVMLHMFTYAEITYLEITTFNELKSDLSNCFSATYTLVNPT